MTDNTNLHHACYVAKGKTPTWIQPASHTYRPGRYDYAWKIVCVETGKVIERYTPSRG